MPTPNPQIKNLLVGGRTKEKLAAYARAWRALHREESRKKNREYMRLWRKKTGDTYRKKYESSNLHKIRAQEKVKYAIRIGKLKRLPCRVCRSPKTDAHHTDYSKPLEVMFLCRLHHREQHRFEKAA